MENFEKGKILDIAGSVSYESAGVVSKQILKNAAGNITVFSFAKGQGLSTHSAPFDALVQVLDGEAEILIGGVPRRLKSGDFIILPANVPHSVFAVDSFKMLLTMIYASESPAKVCRCS